MLIRVFLRFEPLVCDPKDVLLVIFGDMPGAAELASSRDTRDRGFGELLNRLTFVYRHCSRDFLS